MSTDAKQGAVIVTAADENYLDVLKGLILSIRDLEAARASAGRTEIKVIDLGLGERGRRELSEHCDILMNARPMLETTRTDLPRAHLLSRAAKCFIKEYFPGYGVYVWLDADTWVQDLGALDMLIRAARLTGTAVVPEIDRNYRFLYAKADYHYRTNYDWMADSFGESVARDLLYRPVLNAGVIAMHHESPLWDAWRKHLAVTFEKASKYVADQSSLNVALYTEGIRFHPLPSACNWLCCHALPRLDTESMTFTEPTLPYGRLGILHLTKTFIGREVKVATEDDAAEKIPVRLDYLSLRELRSGRR